MNKELAQQAGLIYSGKDFEGNDDYIGTTAQWSEYTKLEEQETQELLEENNKLDYQESMASDIED